MITNPKLDKKSIYKTDSFIELTPAVEVCRKSLHGRIQSDRKFDKSENGNDRQITVHSLLCTKHIHEFESIFSHFTNFF